MKAVALEMKGWVGKSGGELGEEAGRSETVHAGPLISARAALPGT